MAEDKLEGAKPGVADIEYWDPECVDNFENYNKNLTEGETKALRKIRAKIFSLKTPDEDIPGLYREAVDMLHCVWCRERQEKTCILRERTEEEADEGIGFYGVSEVIAGGDKDGVRSGHISL